MHISLSTAYKYSSSIPPFFICTENVWGHHSGFRRNRSNTDHIFCIRQKLEKIYEYDEGVNQLFVDFKKSYDSVRREVLHNILMECCIPMKMLTLIKMCLNETYSRVWVGQILFWHIYIYIHTMALKQETIYIAILLHCCFRVCLKEDSCKSRELEIKWYTLLEWLVH